MNDSERIADLEQQINTLKEAVRLLVVAQDFEIQAQLGNNPVAFCASCRRIVSDKGNGVQGHAPDCALERVRRLVGE